MQFKYGFGKTYKEFSIEDKNVLMELRQNEVKIELSGSEEVARAIKNPIDTKRLSEIVKRGERIVIITSDITRPMPSKIVLPPLIEELASGGIKDEDIKIVFALGSHRKHTEEEMKYLVGEDIYSRIKCVDSDPEDCMRLGSTSSGTPVDIYSEVAKADRRICLGNIEFHYFAGYSGGAKAIMPGVSTRDAIQANHSAMVKEAAKAGAIDDNPVRKDIDEVAQFVPIDFIVNVVLDEQKNVIKAVAGHYKFAHREGCRFLDSLYKVEIPEKADIVVATPGGYPKDINLYQAQKALDNAKHAVKDGGIIIMLASCAEGLGEEVFERWIRNAKSPDSMIEDIQKNFELGGHKAAAIALVQKKAKIYLVSDLDKNFVKSMFMEPFDDMNAALKQAFIEQGNEAKVILMPYGGSTLPVMKRG
ncbi:MAG: nickel-dependent lactate racemase [Clostridia bacterium]|nr:nickel-dependent lactate racemase [Clostridia bacterium]